MAAAAQVDAIKLFAQKMRASHERDQALADVVRLRDAGTVRVDRDANGSSSVQFEH
jgi:hypothetical protein